MARIIGIDWGEKRIGIAITDEMQLIALPYKTLDNNSKVFWEIKDIIIKENVGKIVLGLPIAMSGQSNATTVKVKEFAKVLKDTIKKPVVLEDERLTSTASVRSIKEVKRGKGDIDMEAARKILESFIGKSDLKDSFKI